MRLTRRGENVIAGVLLLVSALIVIAAFFIGQDWKQDRLRQEVNSSVGVER